MAARASARAAIPVVASRCPAIRRAYIFGSVTRPGAFRADSDIDVAVEGELSADAYFSLWRDLEAALPGWEVDLVELDQDIYFATRVRESGELAYERCDSTA